MPAILIHVPATPSLDGQPRIEHMTRMQQDLASLSSSPRSSESGKEADGTMGSTMQTTPKMIVRAAAATRKPKIAIVGAGFAGLRAADVLLRAGVEVTILEARNRIGGRVCCYLSFFTLPA